MQEGSLRRQAQYILRQPKQLRGNMLGLFVHSNIVYTYMAPKLQTLMTEFGVRGWDFGIPDSSGGADIRSSRGTPSKCKVSLDMWRHENHMFRLASLFVPNPKP